MRMDVWKMLSSIEYRVLEFQLVFSVETPAFYRIALSRNGVKDHPLHLNGPHHLTESR
jgi:hypothetical protein